MYFKMYRSIECDMILKYVNSLNVLDIVIFKNFFIY